MKSAGRLLAMRRQRGSFDVVDDVREAVYQYIAWRAARERNPRLTLADHLAEQDFLTASATPMQAALARLLEADRFGAVLEKYADLVAQQSEDAQGLLGGIAERRTPLQLLGFAERALLNEGERPVTPDPESQQARHSVTRAQETREYDDVVRRYTNPDGTKRRGWMKAPNGKPTNLTERQWVQVRTPSFKRWFGDWEREAVVGNWFDIGDARTFVEMPAVDVSAVPPLVGKAAFKAVFAEWGEVTNSADGLRVVFPNASAGKMERAGGVSGALKTLFEMSRRAWSERDDGRHPNIAGVHHYLAKARTVDGECYVHFTVREDNRQGNAVHAATVSSVDVYTKKDAEITPGEDLAKSARFVDGKIAYFLGGINPPSVSQVVDENGEPRVVYHGTSGTEYVERWNPRTGTYDTEHKEFTVFKRNVDGFKNSGHFFSDSHDVAGSMGSTVYRAWLSLRNPLVVDGSGMEWGNLMFDGRRMDANEISEYAERNGHDGVIIRNTRDGADFSAMQKPATDYVAFSSSQIKSATDNAGAFDARNADIRYSVAEPYDPRGRVPNVRGGWSEKKILRYLKDTPSASGVYAAVRMIAEFDTVEELKEHMFYHGTKNFVKGLQPSIVKSEKWRSRTAEADMEKGTGESASPSRRKSRRTLATRTLAFRSIQLCLPRTRRSLTGQTCKTPPT
ncbi:MAG: hypothetical protein ACI4RA_00285 [Kiritimatiellia bacterium]